MGRLGRRFLLKLAKAKHELKQRDLAERKEGALRPRQITATQPLQSMPLPQSQPLPEAIQQLPSLVSQSTIQSSPTTQVQTEKHHEAANIKRIEIPKDIKPVQRSTEDATAEIRSIDEVYPLTVTKYNGRTTTLASARIKYNPEINRLEYFIIEPQLTEHLSKIIERTKEELHEKLDADLNKLQAQNEVYKYINSKVDEIWAGIGLKLSPEETLIVKYYILRDTIGLNKIEILMQDPNIEDIGCDGINLPVFIFHRNPLYGDITTNIKYDTKEDLDSFVMKLAQKSGRTISVASPLMDGTLPDGSRVQITYGTDIARKGSNFTIRKFFKIPLTPIDLITFGTIDAVSLAYLWLAIEKEKSILIAGTTATGKTTLLNAVSIFIPPTSKIVSIEDTAELRLTHSNWVPQVTRSATGQRSFGEISMYTLLKSALRQRPDYLIVGEVRGEEASVLFQAMATGHPGLSTLHADNIQAVIHRLTSKPINLPVAALDNLDLIIFLEKAKKQGRFARRVSKIIEIEGFHYETNQIKTNDVFSWDPKTDKLESHHSSMLQEITEKQGWEQQKIQEEISRRAHILSWIRNQGIYKFADVSNIIHMYYADPKKLEALMGGK